MFEKVAVLSLGPGNTGRRLDPLEPLPRKCVAAVFTQLECYVSCLEEEREGREQQGRVAGEKERGAKTGGGEVKLARGGEGSGPFPHPDRF